MLAPLLVLALAIAPNVPAVAAVDVEAPVSLTASDGSGLAIARYDVDTVIVGPLAYTELRLAFDNPQDRVIEGRFNIALPDGAAVSRFAMQIDGQWQEAEVVEKQAARRAYEDALHRRQDPALLEQASPNAFSARVFPIAAKGRKELIVSWSEELAGRPWRLPLLGLPQLAAFKARVRHDGRVVVDERHERWVPTKDLAPTLPPIANALLRSDDVVVARVTIPGTSSSSATSSSSPSTAVPTLILLDTSASRGLGEGKDRRFVKDLAARLDPSGKQRFVVVGFDQTSAVLYDGKATAVSLAERRALGASNLGAALDDAARLAKAHGLVRVVIVGDGLVTAGVEGDALVAKAKALGAVGVRRLDAIAVGGLRDVAALRRLVGAGLAEEGIVVDASDDADLAAVSAKRLGLPAKSNVAVAIEGASQVWPRRLDGVQPGDQVVVVAELARGKPVKLTVGGAAVSLTTVVDDSTTGALRETAAPLLRRAWARAKIERLLAARTAENNPAAKAEIAEQIVKVSVEHRVLSPLTAMIVLETEADYARFAIARTALKDILVVDDAGLTLRHRAAPVVAKPAAPPPAPKADLREKNKKAMKPTAGRAAPGGAADSDVDDSDGAVAREGEEEADASKAELDDAAPLAGGPPPPPPPPPSSMPAASSAPAPARRAAPAMEPAVEREEARSLSRTAPPAEEPERQKVDPYTGTFAEVMKLVASKKLDLALAKARGWREENKGDLLALLALGEVFEAQGNLVEAGRAYGALIDLFADRADIRRLAGARLDRLAGRGDGVAGAAAAAVLAEDTWRHANEDRPDHPQGARGQAYALLRLGHRHKDAFVVVEAAIKRGIHPDRFRGVDEILRDDLGLIGAAWLKAQPSARSEIEQRLKSSSSSLPTKPSTRFVLWWETDANDVDFHIHDAKKNHAYYSQKDLASGGRLYADVTTGFGPECFTIEGVPTAYPYRLEAHYYSRGPMGFGMGALRVVQHDGNGTILVEDRPFVIMVDGAFVDLGVVRGPLR